MNKIAFRYGLWMFAGFTAFFLLMHLFGLSDRPNLRIFNGVIHMVVLFLAIRQFNEVDRQGASNYVSSVALGMYTSAIGVIGFSIFLFFFLVADPNLMEAIRTETTSGVYLTPITATLFIVTEGTVVSLIGSYIIARIVEMNYTRVHH